jgi:hypothetical protein
MRRTIAPLLLALTVAGSAQAADLAVHPRQRAVPRSAAHPWCVIHRAFLGPAVWQCAPTLALCRPFEIPGTGLFCVRDPVWRGPAYLAAHTPGYDLY